VSEPAEYVPFASPRRLFQDGAIAKAEQGWRLAEALGAAREPEPSEEEIVDRLADAVAERVVARLRA
jgi:hypothetical protein